MPTTITEDQLVILIDMMEIAQSKLDTYAVKVDNYCSGVASGGGGSGNKQMFDELTKKLTMYSNVLIIYQSATSTAELFQIVEDDRKNNQSYLDNLEYWKKFICKYPEFFSPAEIASADCNKNATYGPRTSVNPPSPPSVVPPPVPPRNLQASKQAATSSTTNQASGAKRPSKQASVRPPAPVAQPKSGAAKKWSTVKTFIDDATTKTKVHDTKPSDGTNNATARLGLEVAAHSQKLTPKREAEGNLRNATESVKTATKQLEGYKLNIIQNNKRITDIDKTLAKKKPSEKTTNIENEKATLEQKNEQLETKITTAEQALEKAKKEEQECNAKLEQVKSI